MEHPLSNTSSPNNENCNEQGEESASATSPTKSSSTTSTTTTKQYKLRGPVEALNREAMKDWVLRTYTADSGFPVVSSVVTEVSNLSEDQRARLRLQRLEAMSTSHLTTSGGIVTAPVEKKSSSSGSASAGSASAGTSPISPTAASSDSKLPQQHSDPNAAAAGSMSVSQNEIVHLLETMDTELKRHWQAGDKVKALRLAIQSTKMLSHSSKVPECFPSMFVLVATVLDSIGDRVADRIGELAISRDPVIEHLIADGKDLPCVPDEAAELCGNWFHKILSIRELLCRVTVELALLKCFKFAGEKEHVPVKQVIVRLANQIRGVANAQVASHLRWYLFLRARDELSKTKSNTWAHSLAQCAIDNIEMMSRMPLPVPINNSVPLAASSSSSSEKNPKAIEMNNNFLATFQPSLRWMFDTMVRYGGNASGRFVEETMRLIEESEQLRFGAVCIVFLQCAPAEFLFKNFERVWAFIDMMDYSSKQPKIRALSELLAALSDPSCSVGKLSKSKRAQMLNMIFGAITEEQNNSNNGNNSATTGATEAYFFSLTAAIQFTSRYLPFNAVVTVVEEVRRLVSQVEQDGSSSSLATLGGASVIEENVTTIIRAVTELLPPDSYIACTPFVNLLLTTSSLSQERRRELVEGILHEGGSRITVPSVAISAFELCRVLHDALPPTSTPEEIERVELIITRVVAKTFSPNAVPDTLLRFYSECRHVLNRFSNLRKMILYEALRLVVAVPQAMIQKRRQQLRPCLAFVHATCPSVANPLDRARVAADAACVAYERGFVAQGEALMETALTSLNEVRAIDSHAQTSIGAGCIKYNDGPAVSVGIQLVHVGVVMPPPDSKMSSSLFGSSSASSPARNTNNDGEKENETATTEQQQEQEEEEEKQNYSQHQKAHQLYVVDAVLRWAEEFPWNDPSQPSRLAATVLSLLARAKSGSLLQRNDDVYRFSSLQRVALHKIPEYVHVCKSLQLRALRLLKASMPCEESNDAIEVTEILLGSFLAASKDSSTHVALHMAVSPLLYGQYANAEMNFEAFRTSKSALVGLLENFEDENLVSKIKNGTGSAAYENFEAAVEQEEDEDAL